MAQRISGSSGVAEKILNFGPFMNKDSNTMDVDHHVLWAKNGVNCFENGSPVVYSRKRRYVSKSTTWKLIFTMPANAYSMWTLFGTPYFFCSLSGCPIAAMGKLAAQQNKQKQGEYRLLYICNWVAYHRSNFLLPWLWTNIKLHASNMQCTLCRTFKHCPIPRIILCYVPTPFLIVSRWWYF